jgi:hypothetical protein
MGDTQLQMNGHGPALTASVALRVPADDGDALRSLADELAERCPLPVDSQELAALLESLGVIDEVAQRRYGADDTFVLAEAMLAARREVGLRQAPPAQPAHPPVTARQRWLDYARGPQSLGVIIVLMAIIAGVGTAGQLSQQALLALSLGMSGSMLVTNGLVQAASRRGAIYLSRGNSAAARRFLALAARPILSAILATGLCALLALGLGWRFGGGPLLLFAAAYFGLSLVWLAAAVLSLLDRSAWLGLALVMGLVVGALAHALGAPLGETRLALGGLLGYATAMGLMLAVAWRQLGVGGEATRLPSVAYLLHEAAPFFCYGVAYMGFVFLPHLLGAVGPIPDGGSREAAFIVVELGLTLGLLPLIAVGGMLEHTARRFWGVARVTLQSADGAEPASFVAQMRRFLHRELRAYLVVLALASALFGWQVLLALKAGLLAAWVAPEAEAALSSLLLAALLAYGLLGWALFNCMLCVLVGRPGLLMPAIAGGLLAQLLAGAAVSRAGGDYVGLAFVAGSLCLLLLSTRIVRRMVSTLDYYYVTSF